MRRRTYIGTVAAIVFAIACGRCANHVDNNPGDGGDGGGGSGGGGAGDGGGVDDLAMSTASADLVAALPPFVYVSGYSTTIARYTLDLASGALTSTSTTTATGSPSFLAVDPSRRHLYAVDEANSKVEAF